MASDNSSFFSNGYPSDNLTFNGNIYNADAKPKYALGFRVGRADGSVFRYGQHTTTTAAGLLVGSQTSLYSTGSNCLNVGTAATAVAGQVATPGTSGSRFIQTVIPSSPTVVKNCWAGGYFLITGGTGSSAATSYRIKGNTAAGSPSSTTCYIELYEPLQTTLDATTDFYVITCPYSDLGVMTLAAEATIAPAGVTMTQTTATTFPFAFVQTWGVSSVLADAHVITAGEWVQASTITAGTITPVQGGTLVGGSLNGTIIFSTPIVGYSLLVNAASVNAAIYLTIAR